MKKRILSMLLAALMIVTSFPTSADAARDQQSGNYSVNLASDTQEERIGVGETLAVTVTVEGNDDTVTFYNAYDVKLTYDAERLTFVSGTAADSDAQITEASGSIRVKGYGADKSLSTPAVTLIFEAKKQGEAFLRLTSAKVDISDNAGLQNAPAADIPQDLTAIQISGYAVVTIGEGIGVNSHFATGEEDFPFWLMDYDRYDYSVQVTIGGVDVTDRLHWDETTGTYTIPKSEINGKIVIIAQRTPKAYKVTIIGEDVTGEETAFYNTDYTFHLERKAGYQYTVAVTIGGESYTGYTAEGDTYTIPGADITGAIVIRVTKTENDGDTLTVTFTGSGAQDGKGNSKAKYGEEYSFKVNKKNGYTYSVTAWVDGQQVPCEYDKNLDIYHIPGEYVTGNITIVINKIATVEVCEYITLDEQSMYLIVYNGPVGNGKVPRYDGESMYWSDRYHAYVWLVVSSEAEKDVKTAAERKTTLGTGTAAGTVLYTGNVNMSRHADDQDAQLVHEMYNAKYTLTSMEMQKFLNADVCTDRKINVADAAAIVRIIRGERGEA